MKISIIIPAYNTEHYLSDCMDSIISQQYPSLEIIVVNDGSTDNTLELLRGYSEKYSYVQVIDKRNEGQSIARNTGADIATGDYVLFVDSDDILSHNSLKGIADFISKHQIDMLLFNGDAFYENNTLNAAHAFKYIRNPSNNNVVMTGLDYLFRSVKGGNFIAQPCLYCFRRGLFDQNKFYPNIIHEDNLFTASLLLNSEIKVLSVSEFYYSRRVRDGSTMTTNKTIKNVIGYKTCGSELLKLKNGEKRNDTIINKLSGNWLREAILLSTIANDFSLKYDILSIVKKSSIPYVYKATIYYPKAFLWFKCFFSRAKNLVRRSGEIR